jgi:hypothetical protein
MPIRASVAQSYKHYSITDVNINIYLKCESILLIFCTVASLSFLTYLILPPLWSSGQSFWLQIQRSGFDSRPYQIY